MRITPPLPCEHDVNEGEEDPKTRRFSRSDLGSGPAGATAPDARDSAGGARATNVSDDDEITTGKIARAHLNEFPDYYTRLAKMEAEAQRYWSERRGGSAS